MRNYKFKRKTDLVRARRNCFLVDVSDDAMYYINIIRERTYFAKDNESLRTIEEGKYQYLAGTTEEGKYQYLAGTYILCSEDMIPYIYE